MGVVVVSSDIIEHYRAYIEVKGFSFVIGGPWKIIVWSKEDFCEKEGANRPDFV